MLFSWVLLFIIYYLLFVLVLFFPNDSCYSVIGKIYYFYRIACKIVMD